MEKEFVLYGQRETDKYEELLIVRNTKEALKPYIDMARKQGFTKIRIAEHDYADAPDFAGAVNI